MQINIKIPLPELFFVLGDLVTESPILRHSRYNLNTCEETMGIFPRFFLHIVSEAQVLFCGIARLYLVIVKRHS